MAHINERRRESMYRENGLKRRLAAGETVIGCWVDTGSATIVEILGHAGFDFVVIDLEHGQGDIAAAAEMIRAAQLTEMGAVVRVPSNDPVFLKRILEVGADSIMIPQIESEEEARAAVRACRYPPQGARGYAAPVVRASSYGKVKDYIHRANDNLLLILQIESAAAAKQAAAIAQVEGVDVAFIGVNDLGGSIGKLEQLDHPEVRKLVAEAEAALKPTGRWLGTVPSAGATPQDLFAAGYRMVPLAVDVSLIRDAAIACLKQHAPGKAAGAAKGY
jgi:4-hydroxy-2-oxoheptanedioate aldolase